MPDYQRFLGCLVAVFLMTGFAQFAVASKSATVASSAQSGVNHTPVQGFFVIYTLQKGAWIERGRLGYNRFFTTGKLDLSPYLEPGDVKIRVVERGGEAAHIDSVLLEGKPPVSVSDRYKKNLKKLASSDFDVIDAYDTLIEFGFDLPKKGESSAELLLTGRIEGKRISSIPFHYPLANLYHPITGDSQFYDYTLGSNQGKLNIDGNIGNERLGKPLFSEFSRTGSGHPSGTTYGWVRNDHKNLYVAIDFTPDDTMDGAKDYTKVFVKTDAGIREFKVSVPEQKWGKPGFSYTDKVSYQHKVYEFAIPLSELDIKRSVAGGKGIPLQLAFAAYGTAAPPSLSVTKTDAPDPVSVGANLTYTMVVTNNTPPPALLGLVVAGPPQGSALLTVLVDTLPASVNPVSATSSQGTCGIVGVTVTCQLGTILPAGATATVTVVVSPTVAGTITNSATVSAQDIWGTIITPVIAQAVTTVNAPPALGADLSIIKSCLPNPVGSEQLISCSVHVKNNGPATANAVKVIDAAWSSLHYFILAIPSRGKCTGVSQIICHLGRMNRGESATIHTFFTPRVVGTFVNNASVSSATPDPGGQNNFVSKSIVVNTGPAPVSSLSVDSRALLPGQTAVISTALNPGPVPLSADLYLIELQPDGTALFLQSGGTFTPVPTALLSNWTVPTFTGPVYSKTFTAADPQGTYRVFASLFQPGTFNLIATVAVTSFSLGK